MKTISMTSELEIELKDISSHKKEIEENYFHNTLLFHFQLRQTK